MEKKKIGVGTIGASITSWAARAHIPALKLIPEFELIAVSTSKMSSAKEAADTFGATQDAIADGLKRDALPAGLRNSA